MTAHERLRAALLEVLDAENGDDGWLLDHYIVVMGVQRIDSNGKVSSSSCMTFPEDQAYYVTMGLLDSGFTMQADATEEVDGD